MKVQDKTVPLPNPPQGTLVILRGRLAIEPPFQFEDVEEQQTVPLVQFYEKASPFPSFRVVIETPKP